MDCLSFRTMDLVTLLKTRRVNQVKLDKLGGAKASSLANPDALVAVEAVGGTGRMNVVDVFGHFALAVLAVHYHSGCQQMRTGVAFGDVEVADLDRLFLSVLINVHFELDSAKVYDFSRPECPDGFVLPGEQHCWTPFTSKHTQFPYINTIIKNIKSQVLTSRYIV